MPLLLLLCFFLSGASGLCLEVVWVRQLTHVFGSTTLAISTVLATFMGGLALGSWLGGRYADRTRRGALASYALCELGIAACALAIPLVLGGYPEANAWLWRRLGDSPTLLALARFALSGLVLVAPTTLMGATLPILARHVVRTRADFGVLGRRVGTLYAANTAGAVFGVAAAGFWLLPMLGVARTNQVAVAADVLLAGAILLATLRKAPTESESGAGAGAGSESGSDPDPAPRLSPLDARLALLAFALSGAVAMTLEVLWSRALALVIGSSVYSFTLVLMVFLVGLSAGAAWIGRPAARARDPLGALALVFAGVGAATLVTHLVIDDLPGVFLALLEGSSLEVGTLLGLQGLVAGIAVLPTAACLGAVMPLCVRAYAGSVDAVGRDVGRAYAMNTVGAIAGSFAGGFVVLPLVGLDHGVRGCALADLALAALLAARARSRAVRRFTLAAAPALAVAVVLAPAWDVAVLTSGVFRITVAKRFVAAGQVYRPEVVYYRDGVSTTVTVERHGERLALKNNGKVEASSVADMPTQILVGLVPVVLHGGADQRVAVVGYGSGVTVGAIAESPAVGRVDVIEIEPAVYEAADRWFAPYNHAPHRNPRVHRWVGDGRNFLVARPERYDVIVSEPSNPWIAGVASLFTREFYAFARSHLAEGGLFCQWAQLYELGPRNVKTIYRTFHEAFPYVYAFSAADLSADTILVGSDRPLPFDLARLDGVFAGGARAELGRGGVRSPEDLVAMLILAPDEIAAFAAGGDVNTDDNARLEFTAPRDLLAAGRTARFADAIYADLWPYGHLDTLLADPAPARATALAGALVAHGKRREAGRWIERARAGGAGADAEAVAAILRLTRTRDFVDPELALAAGGPPFTEPTTRWFAGEIPEAERLHALGALRRARAAVAAGRWEDAWHDLHGLPLPADSDDGRDLRLLYGFVLYKTLRLAEATSVLETLAERPDTVTRRPAVLYYLGRVKYGDGRFQRGTQLLTEFARRFPALVE